MELEEEANKASDLLSGKTIKSIHRFRCSEVLIEFTDGTRFFIDGHSSIELSITQASQQKLEEFE